MWHEGIAKRGANEISSCLLAHIQSLPSSVESLTFFSDSCSGQNKNSIVALMFSIIASTTENIKEINHKFLVPGHTHMECDVDHSIIERKKKKTTAQIHHPRDWYQFIRNVRTKKPFCVKEMNQNTIFNFNDVLKNKCVFRKTDEDNNKVNWRFIKWLRYTKEFGTIEYKNSLSPDEKFKKLNIRKRGFNQIQIDDVPKAYTEPIKISAEKKKDLISMLPLIDSVYHMFYNNLSTEIMSDFHPDITEEDVDETI